MNKHTCSSKWLLFLVLISLVSSNINPTMAGPDKQGNNQFNKQISNSRNENQILIFVSFSLPDEALKSYYQEARLLGGKLIMRGLKNNSFQDTQVKTRKLAINLDIDPSLFEEYGVVVVPTIVLISDGNKQDGEQPNSQLLLANQECSTDGQHQQLSKVVKKITGHVPLAKALEIMERKI